MSLRASDVGEFRLGPPPAQVLAAAQVYMFSGRCREGLDFQQLDGKLAQLRNFHARGGILIFLADSLPPKPDWAVFAQAAGVNLAARGPDAVANAVTLSVKVGKLSPGTAFAVTPTRCAPGWQGTAEVVAATPQGPYCVRGNRIAFVEASGIALGDAEPMLTPEEQEFIQQLVIDMAS
jgi:hypothetical protein